MRHFRDHDSPPFGPGFGAGSHGGRGKGRPHHGRFHRRFRTREERIARLESYLNDLRLEAQAVEERLAELNAAG